MSGRRTTESLSSTTEPGDHPADVEPYDARSRPLVHEAVPGAAAAVADLGIDGIANARWSGLARAQIKRVSILDAFPLGASGGLVVVAAAMAAGAPVLLTVPIDDTATWTGLHELVIHGSQVAGTQGGRLIGQRGRRVTWGRTGPTKPLAVAAASTGPVQPVSPVRPVPGDQSHTSVILDENSILKLYRRLTTGPNLEAETLRALARRAEAPVPDWHGSVELELADGTITSIAIEQALIPNALDAFEWLADGLATWLTDGVEVTSTEMLGEIGLATGRLHRSLAGLTDRDQAPRPPTPADRAEWRATAVSTLDAAIAAVGAVDQQEALHLERARSSIVSRLDGFRTSADSTMLQAIHGDLHLGQVLPTPDHVVIIDFEGDPTRDPADRRSVASPLRDVAGMLRSIDHVARSGLRRARLRSDPSGRAAIDALETWIRSARIAFIRGYANGVGDPAWRPAGELLAAFEVEKELAEFIYAATFLPAWLYAPMGGIRALLGDDFETQT